MTKRAVLIAVSAVLIAVGGTAAIAGGAIMAVFGSDSTLQSGRHGVSTTTAALVADIGDIRGTDGVSDVLGHPSVRVSLAVSGQPTFIGVGRAADVDRYLAGVAVDKVTDLDFQPYQLTTERRDGTARPAAPSAQSFWVARSTGTAAPSLNWAVRDGTYRLVVMNADGSPGVAADARVAVKVPHLFGIGVGVLAAGLTGLLVGVALLVVGLLQPPTPRPGYPYATAPVSPPAGSWPGSVPEVPAQATAPQAETAQRTP